MYTYVFICRDYPGTHVNARATTGCKADAGRTQAVKVYQLSIFSLMAKVENQPAPAGGYFTFFERLFSRGIG